MLSLAALASSALARAVRVHIDEGVPTLLAGGEVLKLSGSESGAPRRAHVQLEERVAHGWKVVARSPLRRGGFVLSWRPPADSLLNVRITVRSATRVLAYSAAVRVRVGSAPRYCPQAPAPSSVPAGDGWIVGGLYYSGGPAPGIFECHGGPYTVAAVDEAGAQTGAVTVADGAASYVLVLPAGSYELQSELSCYSDEVTVVAGKGVKADTICNIP